MAGAFQIRKAVAGDAEGIAAVMHAVVAERVHSAIDRAWTADEERRYLASLSSREAFHVAGGGPAQAVAAVRHGVISLEDDAVREGPH